MLDQLQTIKQDSESFKIKIKGHFGPFYATPEAPIDLDIKPLTVFLGPQGSGKSLISQLLYFFRDAEYLLSEYGSPEETSARNVRNIIDSIRAGKVNNQGITSFLEKTGMVSFHHSHKLERTISLTRYPKKNRVAVDSNFGNEIRHWQSQWKNIKTSKVSPKAIFIPVERIIVPHFINTKTNFLVNDALPITIPEFTQILQKALDLHARWQNSEDTESMPAEALEIDSFINQLLGIKSVRVAINDLSRQLQIVPRDSQKPIDIEMASSGQMSTLPIVLVAKAWFGWHPEERPIFLHIEEPEASLHPWAQVALVNLLAYLVNHGMKLVITTHSLYILSAINNLLLAHEKLADKPLPNMPRPSIRLSPNQVAAYICTEGTVKNIFDEDNQIDESLLGNILGNLETQFSRMMTYKIVWE